MKKNCVGTVHTGLRTDLHSYYDATLPPSASSDRTQLSFFGSQSHMLVHRKELPRPLRIDWKIVAISFRSAAASLHHGGLCLSAARRCYERAPHESARRRHLLLAVLRPAASPRRLPSCNCYSVFTRFDGPEKQQASSSLSF